MDRLSSRTFASASTVDLAGLPIAIALRDERRMAAFQALLGTLPDTTASPRAHIVWNNEPALAPARPSEYPHDDGLEYWVEPEHVLYRYNGITAVVTNARIELGGDTEALELPFRYVLEPALTHLLAREGRFMVHAGAITEGDTTFLLIGESGQGKSTLCWAAAQAGWSLLADDHAILRATESGFELTGLPKPVYVPEEIMDEPAGVLVERRGRRRRRLPATMLATGWHPLDAVIQPRHGITVEGALQPAPAGELLDLLIGSFAALGQPQLLRRFFPHAAALTRLPCWDLFHASDPATRLQSAAQWLDVARQSA